MLENFTQEIIKERDYLKFYYDSEKNYIPLKVLRETEVKIKLLNKIIKLLEMLKNDK